MTENNNTFAGLITNVEIDGLDGTGLEILKKSLFGEETKKWANYMICPVN